MGEVFGWGGEDAFHLRSPSWKRAFCVRERETGRRICAYHEGRWGGRKLCLFHKIELRVPIPWEKGLEEDY